MEALIALLIFLFGSRALAASSSTEPPSWCGDQPIVVITGGRTQSDRSLIAADGTRFPPGCYWKSSPSVTEGCANQDKPCFLKCCLDDQTLSESGKKCVEQNETQRHPFQPKLAGDFDITKYNILKGHPYCLLGGFQLGGGEVTYAVDENTTLRVKQLGIDEYHIPAGEYCLDNSKNGMFVSTMGFACFPKDKNDGANSTTAEEPRYYSTFVIYSIARIISLPFLVATLVVYAIIPELRNLHGKCLMSHVSCLIVAHVFLVVIQLASSQIPRWFCIASALIDYFFLLGSFFWLNIMCFDIWWTFSVNRRVAGYRGSNEWKGFLLYSLYAWGAPVAMLCVCLVLEFSAGIPDTVVRPEFGTIKCWFKDRLSSLLYFHGPVAVLIAANIVFFAITALNILKIQKETEMLSGSESHRSANHEIGKQRFMLYLKLFVVMGVTWSLELIGWAIGGPDYIWWIPDIANSLQGVIIFIIFVWKARIRQLLRKKFNLQPSAGSPAASPTASTSLT